MPVAIGLQRTLVDTAEVHVRLDAVRVYSSGLCFRVIRALRPGAGEAARRAFAEGLAVGPPGPFDEAELLRGPLLGVRYADGRGAVLDLFCRYLATLPAGGAFPVLEPGGAGSTDTEAELEVHLYGLPEQGSITLVWRWEAVGVPESSLELDGDALRAAAARALVLWEEPPENVESRSS
jgi:hypothetical protein